VQTEQSRNVWVVGPDKKVEMRPVQTAGWLGGDWIVTKGLNAGDLVVTDNLMKLRPGTAVEARESAPPPAKS